MRTVPLRFVARAVVEPATEALPIVQLEHVESRAARLLQPPTVVEPAGTNRFLPGDVLFSKLRPYLAKSLLVTDRLQGSGEFLCLRPGPRVDPRFLLYATLSQPWLDHAALTSYGTKMPRTSWEQMANFRLNLPDAAEQRRIADFLDDRVARIDQIIGARRAQKSLIGSALSAEYLEALQGLTTAPVRRLVREIVVGIVIQPSRLYTEDPDGVPALRGLNVKAGFISTADLVKITSAGHAENRRSAISPGDVVVVRTGDAGAAAVVPPEAEGWNCIDILVARPGESLSAEFLEVALNAARLSADISAASSGSIQQHFGVEALGALPIPAASPARQASIVDRIRGAREDSGSAEQSLVRSIDLLTEYKQSLITAAVTGELDVTTAGSGIPG